MAQRIYKNMVDQIWYGKEYRYGDETIEEFYDRIASVGKTEEERNLIREVVSEKLALAAGRILSNTGTGRARATMANCYVRANPEDSIDGIMRGASDVAKTVRTGGGIGVCFDHVRPNGAWVSGTESYSGGVLPFMRIYDVVGQSVCVAGLRRSAILLALNYAHPDVIDFINAKDVQGGSSTLSRVNVSVCITREFVDRCKASRPIKLFHWAKCQDSTVGEVTVPEGHNPYHYVTQEMVYGGLTHFNWGGDLYKVIVYKEIQASDLRDLMLRHALKGEPGFLFIDTINAMNNLSYCENISCANPCAEQVLPASNVCFLGSVNLTKCIRGGDSPYFDCSQLDKAVRALVIWLNRALDASYFELDCYKQASQNTRRIGIGFMGLGDVLNVLDMHYGSKESLDFAEKITRRIANTAYMESSKLAAKEGPFPLYDADKYLQSKFIQQALNEETIAAIRKHGVRNSHLLSIAPTGTVALFADGVSGGLEPVFEAEYIRNITVEKNFKHIVSRGDETYLCMADELTEYPAADGWSHSTVSLKALNNETYAYPMDMQAWCVRYFGGVDKLPSGASFSKVSGQSKEISVADHMAMQSVIQKYLDGATSKTVILPNGSSISEMTDLFEKAYELGLKGITFFEDNDKNSILTSKKSASQPTKKASEEPQTVEQLKEELKHVKAELAKYGKKFKRPTKLNSSTFKLDLGDESVIITVGDVNKKPREVIVNVGKSGSQIQSLCEAIGRLTSLLLQCGESVESVVKTLRGIKDGSVSWLRLDEKQEKPYQLFSVPDAIAKVLQHTYVEKNVEKHVGSECPRCGLSSYIFDGGCWTCRDCGYSKCSG